MKKKVATKYALFRGQGQGVFEKFTTPLRGETSFGKITRQLNWVPERIPFRLQLLARGTPPSWNTKDSVFATTPLV